MSKTDNRLKSIEIALLLALAVTLLWGSTSLQRQDALAQKMIRLHVIANSDSEEDQALKLQVRDQVLSYATDILRSSADMKDAQNRLDRALPQIERLAAEEIGNAGYAYAVSARLEETEFPLKEYDGFSLPGGEYLALRIIIGEGTGHNWWCVVYPPLCTAAASEWEETAMSAGLGEDDIGLITEENTGYALRFRSLELWESLRQWLNKR